MAAVLLLLRSSTPMRTGWRPLLRDELGHHDVMVAAFTQLANEFQLRRTSG
jgi:hypothetical protein